MPATGIWLPDDVYRQQQGQLWMQGQVQAMQGQVQAGQQWASQQLARLQQQAQQQVQAITAPPAPAPTPVPAAQPTMPTPVPPPAAPPPAPIPTPLPAPAPAPAPAQTTPPGPQPPPPPTSTVPTDMLQAGQDWASQQVQNLLQPSQTPAAGPQATPAAMQPSPAPSAPGASGGPPGGLPAPSAAQGPAQMATPTPPAASATASSGNVPAGPQPKTPGDLIDQARQAAAAAGIDPEIFTRQIQQESGFDPNAKSGAGALGIAQFMPGTAQGLGIDPMNPVQALAGAAKLDAQNLAKYGGDWARTLAAYNAGGGAVDKYGGVPPFQETQNYVSTILGGAKDVVQNVAQGAQNLAQQGVQGAQQLLSNAKQAVTGQPDTSGMVFPVVGYQGDVNLHWGDVKGGSDLMAPRGTAVVAMEPGKVVESGYNKVGGNSVLIQGDDGNQYYYAHFDAAPSVQVGDQVKAGTFLGPVGNTGDASGGPTHLHIGIGPSILLGADKYGGTGGDYDAIGLLRSVLSGSQGTGQSTSTAAGPQALAPPSSSANPPTSMNTLQPALPQPASAYASPQDILNQAGNQVLDLTGALRSKAQDTANAVLNMGQNLPDITGLLTPRATDLTSALTPTPSPPSSSGQTMASDIGNLPDITSQLRVDPSTPLGRVVGGTPLGQLSPADQAQALAQWNQQYEQARALGTQNLTGNLPVASGLASLATDPEQLLALAGGGALGEALLPGAGLLPGIGRQALTGALAGGVYGAGQPSATAQDILLNAAGGGMLGGLGGAVGALPGVLRGLGHAAPQTVSDLLSAAPEVAQYSDRGIQIDPITGQEMVPANTAITYGPNGVMIDPLTGQEMTPVGVAPFNSYEAARAANPEATQFVRTAGNQFEPVIQPQPMQGTDFLTGLRNLLSARQATGGSPLEPPGVLPTAQPLIDTLQQLTQKVDQANAPDTSADVQAQLQPQIDALRARLQDLPPSVPPGAQPAAINAAFARALGGGAAGGLLANQTTDPNDPNRWAKIAAGVGAGALALGPGVDLATASPGGVATADWLRAAYRGGIIGGVNTAADVVFNSALSPVMSGGVGLIRDLASFQPGRIQGRVLGAQSGIVNWAGNFLQGMSDSLANPSSVSGRVGPGAPTVIANLLEGMGALHGAFQNATSQLIQSMEHGAESGAAASAQGLSGPAWFNAFQNQFQQPVNAGVQAIGDRAALRGDLGTLTGAFGRFVTNAGPVGDALFPVYRMGMNMANRTVEFSPAGLAGTGFDVARGLLGQGPYAAGLGSTPAGSAVGPLSERLTNNLVGTGLSLWLANQALGGHITGSGPSDPAQHAVWLADGNQPNSFQGPDGQMHSWEKLPAPLRGPMLTAGAYADAVQAYNQASARQSAAGPQAYAVEDPRLAAANQLVSEVGRQLAGATPMRTFANLYDALQGNSVSGTGMTGLTDVGSSILGGLVPFSGEVRSLAEMTDPYTRQTLSPATPGLIPQSIAENVMQNIPGLRQTLPAAQDVLGRPLNNPLQGLGQISPFRAAAGTPSPILQAMQAVGVTPAATPDTVPLGPSMQVRLNPQEQRDFEQYRGQIIQQYADQVMSSPQWQQFGQLGQQRALQNIDTAAQQAATRLVLRDIVQSGDAFTRAQSTGALAPVVGYGPNVTADQAQLLSELQRTQLLHNTLMAALQPSPQDTLSAANQAALAYSSQAQPAA